VRKVMFDVMGTEKAVLRVSPAVERCPAIEQ
jgi:hypothetical protein